MWTLVVAHMEDGTWKSGGACRGKEEAPAATAVRAVDEQQRDVAQAAAARECLAV